MAALMSASRVARRIDGQLSIVGLEGDEYGDSRQPARVEDRAELGSAPPEAAQMNDGEHPDEASATNRSSEHELDFTGVLPRELGQARYRSLLRAHLSHCRLSGVHWYTPAAIRTVPAKAMLVVSIIGESSAACSSAN